MKSALFVDFDNVYSGLRKLDPASADRFARQPLRWVDWLLGDLPAPEHAPDGARRRLLVRRCYLNPQAYQRYRPAFNHAGFEIIDCPAMTSEGKTSTDIHMVLDMVDLLQHEVRYDEFIVFSADADFTPMLRKLRRWDRRTTVLAVGFPSAAYRASADLLIDQDVFVREALDMGDEDESSPAATPPNLTVVDRASPAGHTAPSLVRTAPVEPDADDDGPTEAPDTTQWGMDPVMLAMIRQVHNNTGVPLLSPADFRALLDAVAADVAVEPFQLSETGKRVRDRCRAAGKVVSRKDVNWVLRGILLGGHEFGQGTDDVRTMSYKLVGNLVNLCRREQMVLDETSAPTLHRWVSGRGMD